VSYQVLFTATARRDMASIPPRIVPAIVEFIYGDLATQPHRVGKPLLRELIGTHGARRGSYRIVYRIEDHAERVYILRVDHRSDVYRPR